jgi:antitoxin CcdA
MDYDRSAAKIRVNMTLNDDLVRQARKLTTNLSDTLQQLLVVCVEREANREAERHIEAGDAFVTEHGTLADEFSTL